ncbi:peptidyl-prolyl cis-trans isomerase Pin1-like [Rutidosis leptorrhynchoides]|uniref:peptidyl-prolyl cis-trans isomerase Pin1-like n=1 Tax=Rutidosis leptorrhynchoides TaxID=125765 RepID=UPI003A98CF15
MSSTSPPSYVRVSYILIKHRGSRYKQSWKDPHGEVISNTTKDDAVARLEDIRQHIVSGKATFDYLASTHSDCKSAKRNGDLGMFGRFVLDGQFEKAAFNLMVGEISEIVHTESGVHIIKKTA